MAVTSLEKQKEYQWEDSLMVSCLEKWTEQTSEGRLDKEMERTTVIGLEQQKD